MPYKTANLKLILLIVGAALLSSLLTVWLLPKPPLVPEVVTIDLDRIMQTLVDPNDPKLAGNKEAVDVKVKLIYAAAMRKLPEFAKENHVIFVSPNHALGARDWTDSALAALKDFVESVPSKQSAK